MGHIYPVEIQQFLTPCVDTGICLVYKLNKSHLKTMGGKAKLIFFFLRGCALEILSSSGRKMEFPTSAPKLSSVCASSGGREEEAGWC